MLFLLQNGPAETTGYMVAGYIIIFSVMAIYLVSLVIRRRNLDRDLEAMEDLQEKR